ncbi:MAG: hypothetical protein D6712_05015 [Chloroflexi bacterium]|nr:MAG: hypothetical protein D6712_05015 [Chloroflexota bacterium]
MLMFTRYAPFFVLVSAVLVIWMGFGSDWGEALAAEPERVQNIAYALLGVLSIGGTLAYAQWRGAITPFSKPLLWRMHWQQLNKLIPIAIITIMWLILAGGIIEVDWEFVANLPPEWVLTGAISIGAGFHSAILFSPDDDPTVELLLTMPYALSTLIFVRFVLLVSLYVLLGIISHSVLALINGAEINFVYGVLMWLPGTLLLASLGLFVTLVTRQIVFGVGLVILIWVAFWQYGTLIFVSAPYLYSIHLFLPELGTSGQALMIINRLTVLALAFFLLMWSVTLLTREEYIMTGRS